MRSVLAAALALGLLAATVPGARSAQEHEGAHSEQAVDAAPQAEAARAADAAAAEGDSPSEAAPETVQRVFTIHWRDVQDVQAILGRQFGPELLVVDRQTRTVHVVARPEVVRRVEEWLDQFDVPPHAALVRIVLEKAERRPRAPADGGGADELGTDLGAWTTQELAQTTLQVTERSQTTQAFGPDGAYEIHVALGSVDLERRLMRFDQFDVSHVSPAAEGDPGARRELIATSLELSDRVGRTIMTASDPTSQQALLVRAVGVIREREE